MSFEFFDPANVQFGVIRGPLSAGDFVIVPVDDSVKTVLHNMVLDTRSAIGIEEGQEVQMYEPSQQYSPESRAALPLPNRLATRTSVNTQNRPAVIT